MTARLMRLSGALRGKAVKTTLGNPAAPFPPDQVNRQFRLFASRSPSNENGNGVEPPFLSEMGVRISPYGREQKEHVGAPATKPHSL
jgi:hypothetical protein